jgi:hypothetical protein
MSDDHRLFDKLYSFGKVLDKYQGKLKFMEDLSSSIIFRGS